MGFFSGGFGHRQAAEYVVKLDPTVRAVGLEHRRGGRGGVQRRSDGQHLVPSRRGVLPVHRRQRTFHIHAAVDVAELRDGRAIAPASAHLLGKKGAQGGGRGVVPPAPLPHRLLHSSAPTLQEGRPFSPFCCSMPHIVVLRGTHALQTAPTNTRTSVYSVASGISRRMTPEHLGSAEAEPGRPPSASRRSVRLRVRPETRGSSLTTQPS